MKQFLLVADKYIIKKRFKYSNHGKLCDPVIYKINNHQYILQAETWNGCADMSLIDYETSDFHIFNTLQEAMNAWLGRIPKGTNWTH